MPSFLFRTDADASIGTGHVMRCLALGQALRDGGGSVTFLTSSVPDALRDRLVGEGCTCMSLRAQAASKADTIETIAAAKAVGAAWVIVDGYAFDTAYQNALKEAGLHVLFIDDYGHAELYNADLVLNQNVYAKEQFYAKRSPATSLLLGSRYALLRREFSRWAPWTRKTSKKVKRVLVTLGGADPENVTGRVLQALESDLAVTVVIGGGNPHRRAIEEQAAKRKHTTVVVNALNMAELIAEADLAITASGTTSYELAFLQLPMLTIVLAENQEPIAESLALHGCAVNVGGGHLLDSTALVSAVTALLPDADRRQSMGEAGRRLIDGEGASRVAMRLLGERIRLRLARMDDAKMLFDWANDPAARAASLHSDPIAWEGHVAWLTKKLAEPSSLLLIGFDADDMPVGYVRIENKDGEETLSVATAPEKRGQGYGKDLVRLGAQAFFLAKPNALLHAYVKPENEKSVSLFRSLAFEESAPKEIAGKQMLHFTQRHPSP